jgi:hypothetical protein
MFLGRCLVAMADGTSKPVSELQKGDQVLCCKPYVPGHYINNKYVEREPITSATMVAAVACLLVYPELSYCVRVQDSDLIIRERHPIKDAVTGAWVPACTRRAPGVSYFRSPEEKEMAYHVLLALDAPSNTIVVEGVVVASIGAHIAEGMHYYWHQKNSWFNNYREVAEEMEEVDPEGWERGRVEVTGIRRSGDDDGCTCGFRKE